MVCSSTLSTNFFLGIGFHFLTKNALSEPIAQKVFYFSIKKKITLKGIFSRSLPAAGRPKGRSHFSLLLPSSLYLLLDEIDIPFHLQEKIASKLVVGRADFDRILLELMYPATHLHHKNLIIGG
jgi:hypothetical protein